MTALVSGPYGPGPQPSQGLQVPATVSGNWYAGVAPVTNLTTASVTTTYFAPLVVYRTIKVQALGVFLVTGQTSGAIQLAIYPDTGSGQPLITAAGPLGSTANITATASAANVNGAVTAFGMQPGLYWAAVMSNNTGIVVAGTTNTPANLLPALGGAATQATLSVGGGFINGYTLTGQVFGTWPTSGSPTAGAASVSGPNLHYQSS